ncbi:MAG: HAMP domain-containing sensor histidine kinase [Acidimicrobiales bacterium]
MSDDISIRQRATVAVTAAALAAVVAVPLAVAGYRSSADAIRQTTLNEGNAQIDQALRFFSSEDFEPPGNTWRVNVEGEWTDPIGETWTTPPLLGLAEPALGGSAVTDYHYEGEWTAVATWIGESNVLVTVIDRQFEAADRRAAKLRWMGATLLGLALVAAAGWLGSRRLGAPVRHAKLVNSDFIADAAHELRTPLSIIQASAGHALARNREPEQYRESLEEILAATERAGSSVGELLEFARLESGQSTVRSAPLRLDLLVEEVAASIRVDAAKVEADVGDAVVVEADYNLIRQVVDNVTRNAAARASSVVLRTKIEPRGAVIEIADDGPGFDEGIIEHVFERFRRGDQSGSAGLGMSIAKTIVELHGGAIVAANRSAGGALVTITLPYKQR